MRVSDFGLHQGFGLSLSLSADRILSKKVSGDRTFGSLKLVSEPSANHSSGENVIGMCMEISHKLRDMREEASWLLGCSFL